MTETKEKFMHFVSSFVLDSNGRSHVKLTVYKDYESASKVYESLKKTLAYESVYELQDNDKPDDYQKIVEVHGPNGQKTITEEGSWKRPRGYELLCIPINEDEDNEDEGKVCSFDVKSWPNTRSY